MTSSCKNFQKLFEVFRGYENIGNKAYVKLGAKMFRKSKKRHAIIDTRTIRYEAKDFDLKVFQNRPVPFFRKNQ